MSPEVFAWRRRVSYSDCTVGNHVYYSRYLDILEEARGEFFRHLGLTFLELQTAGTVFPVLEVHASYRSAARYDEVLTVETWPTLVHKVRINLGSRIVKADHSLVLVAETRHVCAGLDDKPRPIPDNLKGRLLPLVCPSPVQGDCAR